MLEFIDKILTTLKTNGFPEKKVSLPTEKMYEAADNRGLSFNKVLDQMKATMEIEIEITDEKIIFSAKNKVTEAQNENPFGGMDFSQMNPADMMKQAQEMMSKMDPAELAKMQQMFMNMSEEEKEEILKKGKDLGLI